MVGEEGKRQYMRASSERWGAERRVREGLKQGGKEGESKKDRSTEKKEEQLKTKAHTHARTKKHANSIPRLTWSKHRRRSPLTNTLLALSFLLLPLPLSLLLSLSLLLLLCDSALAGGVLERVYVEPVPECAYEAHISGSI